MRTRFVLMIALLSTCLVAGTCEFRATSNNSVRPPPESGQAETPPSGLTVDIRIGDPIDGSSIASTSSLLETAEGSPAAFHAARSATITRPIPEPGAAALFGVGLLAAAWRIRRRDRTSGGAVGRQ